MAPQYKQQQFIWLCFWFAASDLKLFFFSAEQGKKVIRHFWWLKRLWYIFHSSAKTENETFNCMHTYTGDFHFLYFYACCEESDLFRKMMMLKKVQHYFCLFPSSWMCFVWQTCLFVLINLLFIWRHLLYVELAEISSYFSFDSSPSIFFSLVLQQQCQILHFFDLISGAAIRILLLVRSFFCWNYEYLLSDKTKRGKVLKYNKLTFAWLRPDIFEKFVGGAKVCKFFS